jgi:Protein of unknown function (DUF2794)
MAGGGPNFGDNKISIPPVVGHMAGRRRCVASDWQSGGALRYGGRPDREALLSESEDWSLNSLWDATPVGPTAGEPRAPRFVAFNRNELDAILNIYGRKVAQGEWRDYAIDHLSDRAVFSIFRRTSEMPLYRVEKIPALARRQGAFRVVAVSGAVLKRGHDLVPVLRVLDRPKLKLVT